MTRQHRLFATAVAMAIAGSVVVSARRQAVLDTVDGELEVVVEDSIAGARIEHFLKTRDRKLRLRYPGPAPGYSSGHRIRARGRVVGGTLELSSDPGAITTLSLSVSGSFGEQRTLVVLVNFSNAPTMPYSTGTAAAVTFSTTSDFFRENSYGQTWLTGDVKGWYTLPMTSAGCNADQIAALADQAVTADGVQISQYRRIIYAFPSNGCSWWGLGTIGGNPSRAWINGSYALKVVAHELGHNFGDYHSQSRPCSAAGCTAIEYGDDRDVMGNPNSGHLNAFQKERLGWLNYGISPAIQTVTTTGTYAIDPLYTPGGTKALKILKGIEPNGARTYYYVESRTRAGYDNQMPTAVLLHTGTENMGNSSFQIDLDPASSAFDATLDAGQTFTDAQANLSIRTLSIGTSGAVVAVTMTATCTRRAPTVTATPASLVAVAAGTSTSFSVSVTNRDDDGCGASTFSGSAGTPATWTTSSSPASQSVVPGATASFTMTITPSAAVLGVTAVTIGVNRAGDPGASIARSIQVDPPGCLRAAATFAPDVPSTIFAQPGRPTEFTLRLTNNDAAACGSTTFAFEGVPPSGMSHQLSSASVAIPGMQSIQLRVTVDPTNLPPGAAQFGARARRNEFPGTLVTTQQRLFVTKSAPIAGRVDFDRDARSDVPIYFTANGRWDVLLSSGGYGGAARISEYWGNPGDVPLLSDFDGDGRIDLTVYRPGDGMWYTRYSSSEYGYAGWTQYQWGIPGDVPMSGDFDGDKKNDLVVYRPATGQVFLRYSGVNFGYANWRAVETGSTNAQPISGDFDGDGRADLGTYRSSDGMWRLLFSSSNYTSGGSYQWGLPEDKPLTRDFDGDGRTDLAVYRPSTGEWFLRFSSSAFGYAGWTSYQWGAPGDVPVPADYDGDGKADLVVFRPSTYEWFVRPSLGGYELANWVRLVWGAPGAVPVR